MSGAALQCDGCGDWVYERSLDELHVETGRAKLYCHRCAKLMVKLFERTKAKCPTCGKLSIDGEFDPCSECEKQAVGIEQKLGI